MMSANTKSAPLSWGLVRPPMLYMRHATAQLALAICAWELAGFAQDLTHKMARSSDCLFGDCLHSARLCRSAFMLSVAPHFGKKCSVTVN